MTSMISAVSGYFTRGKLLSTILPALSFALLFVLLVDLPEIEGWLRLERLAKLDPGWRLALATLAVVVVAGLLDALAIVPVQGAGEVAEDVYVDVDDVYEDDPYGGDGASDWDDDGEDDDWPPAGDRSAGLPGD